MPITLSPKASSEVKRIVTDQRTSGDFPEKVYLRLRVVGGGCSGFQHKLDLEVGGHAFKRSPQVGRIGV